MKELGVFDAIKKGGSISGDNGRVKVYYLAPVGFAKGSKNIPNDMIAQIGEKGHEIVYRSADGSILTPLGKNDMVFTHEMSENLWQLSKMNIAPVPEIKQFSRNGMVNNVRSGYTVIQLNGNIELPNSSR